MSSSYSVLFVCLGNICRSPIAEAAFKAEIHKRKLNIKIDSAGLGAWHIGNPPDPRAIKEAACHGIDISNYIGRQIQTNDFINFTHIIGMDHSNVIHLKQKSPEQFINKISLFLDYTPQYYGQDVVDPYYKDQSAFKKTWEQASLGSIYLADYFEKKL